MARAMHNVVSRQMKMVLQQNRFISISYDKITTINNQFGFLCMPMLLQNWKRQPFFLLFLELERVVDKGTSSNITIVIVYCLIDSCGLSMLDIANKVVCFGANGVIVF